MKDKEGEEYPKQRGDNLVGSERKSLCYLTCIASTCKHFRSHNGKKKIISFLKKLTLSFYLFNSKREGS
uniref:Uncharacterized protein n=1 Tax=Colobus angolensis palliatus TaxID=336983 RepID=A0A2K5IZJ8_COLAP